MKKLFMAAVVSFLVPSALAFAQSSNATVSGTVSDGTEGALIPGVSITATNTQTGIVTSVITNESGTYNFASLQPGVYNLSAELSGFQTHTYSAFRLGLSQQVRLNFTLQVGGVAQSVEVTIAADTLLAATSSSPVGGVLPEYRGWRDLPTVRSQRAGTGQHHAGRDVPRAATSGRLRTSRNVCRNLRGHRRREHDARRHQRQRRAVQQWRVCLHQHQPGPRRRNACRSSRLRTPRWAAASDRFRS